MPPASMFDPAQFNATEWMNSVRDYGGRYAVLTVQAGANVEGNHYIAELAAGDTAHGSDLCSASICQTA